MLKNILYKDLTIPHIYSLMLTIGVIFTLPIFMANVYYVDDLMRASTGILGWVTLGRPLTDITFQALSASSKAVDIFPLGLIFSVVALSTSSIVLIVTSGIRKTLINALVFSLIWFNPMMLQNLSYRFDSLSMSLSMLCCTLASYLVFKKNSFLVVFSILFLICSLSLYQPSIFIFLSCFSVIILCKILNQDFVLNDFLLSLMKIIISFLLAYFLYTKFILPYISFASTRSELIFESPRPLEHIINYLKAIFKQLESLYDSGYKAFLILLPASIIIGAITIIKSSIGTEKIKLSLTMKLLILILSPFACFFLTFMPTAILKETITAPRVFMSFGFIICCSLIMISKLRTVFSVVFLLYAIPTLGLSFSYGNALKQQNDYDDITALEISREINKANESAIIYGINNSPLIVQKIIENKPFLKYIISPSYDWTMSLRLQNYLVSNVLFSFDRKIINNLTEIACENKQTPKKIIWDINSYSVGNYKLISLSGQLPCK